MRPSSRGRGTPDGRFRSRVVIVQPSVLKRSTPWVKRRDHVYPIRTGFANHDHAHRYEYPNRDYVYQLKRPYV